MPLCKAFACCVSSAGADENAHRARGGNGGGTEKSALRNANGAIGDSGGGGPSVHVTFDVGGSRRLTGDDNDDDRNAVFHNTREGTNDEWISGKSRDAGSALLTPSSDLVAAAAAAADDDDDDDDDDHSVYLDAVDDTSGYNFSLVAAYPPVILDSVPPVPHGLLASDMDTWKRPQEEEDALDLEAADRAARAMEVKAERMLRSNFVGGMRRSTRQLRKELTKPGVCVAERGFPGELTSDEVEAAQIFRRELENRDAVYSEIVHGFHEVEEEPYALCRYLRARKFNPEHVFALLDQGKELWKEAKKNNFYPNMEEAIGANQALFTSQYPFVYHGRARNGCPVAYLQCGGLQSEGVLCVTTMEKVNRYFWNSFMYDFIDQLKMCREADKNFMRCECMQVYDLKGLSRAQVNSDAIEVIKMANQITTCFPETLHCLVIVNAPSFFSFAWKLIKKFIDPRTASKIEVYSSEKQQTKRLLELIDESQLSSDYGGNGPSQYELIQQQARTTLDSRGCLSELMHVKGSDTKFEFEIPAGEEMIVCIYSRSKAGAHFSLQKGTTVLRNVDVKPPDGGSGRKGDYVDPYNIEIARNVRGPGRFCIVGRPLSKSLPGFFLFVGDKLIAKQ